MRLALSAINGSRWTSGVLAIAALVSASCESHHRERSDARSGIELVAHRGANLVAPENTLAAARECVAQKVDYLEVDVRTSKDGVMYVLHDRTLDRTTNGTGAIADRLSSYIDTLDAGSWFSDEFTGERVPRLEPFLEALHGEIKIYFDVKSADLKQLVDLVYHNGFERDSFFWFSDDQRAKHLRDIDRTLNLKITAHDVERLEEAAAYDPQIIECRLEDLTPDFEAFCRRRGWKIMVNTLRANTEAHYRDVLRSPADLVNLNDVDLMVGLLQQTGPRAAR